MEDLKARIKEVTDRTSLSKASNSAEAYRTVSSSIDTETPIRILAEIRKGQARLLEETRNLVKAYQESEARSQERHRELCSILVGIAEVNVRGHRSVQNSPATVLHDPADRAKMGSSYGSYSITNGTHLIVCILIHMDYMLLSYSMFKKIVASPVCGRKPTYDVSHLALLLSECALIMNTVEWTRQALLKGGKKL